MGNWGPVRGVILPETVESMTAIAICGSKATPAISGEDPRTCWR